MGNQIFPRPPIASALTASPWMVSARPMLVTRLVPCSGARRHHLLIQASLVPAAMISSTNSSPNRVGNHAARATGPIGTFVPFVNAYLSIFHRNERRVVFECWPRAVNSCLTTRRAKMNALHVTSTLSAVYKCTLLYSCAGPWLAEWRRVYERVGFALSPSYNEGHIAFSRASGFL